MPIEYRFANPALFLRVNTAQGPVLVKPEDVYLVRAAGGYPIVAGLVAVATRTDRPNGGDPTPPSLNLEAGSIIAAPIPHSHLQVLATRINRHVALRFGDGALFDQILGRDAQQITLHPLSRDAVAHFLRSGHVKEVNADAVLEAR